MVNPIKIPFTSIESAGNPIKSYSHRWFWDISSAFLIRSRVTTSSSLRASALQRSCWGTWWDRGSDAFFIFLFHGWKHLEILRRWWKAIDVLLTCCWFWNCFGSALKWLLVLKFFWSFLPFGSSDIGVDLPETAWIHTPIPMFHSCHGYVKLP